jgi:hypothetical protein
VSTRWDLSSGEGRSQSDSDSLQDCIDGHHVAFVGLDEGLDDVVLEGSHDRTCLGIVSLLEVVEDFLKRTRESARQPVGGVTEGDSLDGRY